MFKDLIVEMLTVLASYSVTVDELKAIFYALKCEDKIWVCMREYPKIVYFKNFNLIVKFFVQFKKHSINISNYNMEFFN